MNKKIRIVSLILAASVALAGCSMTGEETAASSDSSASGEDLYSDRDYETDYDTDEAQYIELDGEGLTITSEGTYVISGAIDDGQLLIDAGEEDKIQLVLDGVDITSYDSAAIYILSADKVFITTEEGSVNHLTNTAGFAEDADSNEDAVIFSKADLTLNGEGTLIVSSADNGITSKDDLVITGGTYEIECQGHALQGKDLIAIADGVFDLTSGEDAIHGKNSDDAALGDVTINGGSFTITAGDDAVHSESDLLITDCSMNILSCEEGLEGNTVTITGGDIVINSKDDAINAAGSSASEFAEDASAYIDISGGTIDITCSGDGIDSNGSLTVSGGFITISGPDNGGNGSMDYNGSAEITGGTMIACGINGMAQNFTEAGQGSILIATELQQAGTKVMLSDKDGNEILSFEPGMSYSSILISSPELKQGETYVITAGTDTYEITLEDLICGQTEGMGGAMPEGSMPNGGGMPGGRMGDQRPQMPG